MTYDGLGGEPDILLACQSKPPGRPGDLPRLPPGAVQHEHAALSPLKLKISSSLSSLSCTARGSQAAQAKNIIIIIIIIIIKLKVADYWKIWKS